MAGFMILHNNIAINIFQMVVHGAELLTIHNVQQETYVETFIYNAQLGGQSSLVWIGLHYQFEDWGWSDGTALGYTDWILGEPSTAGDCAAIQTGNNNNNGDGWKVADCNKVLPYVCYHNALSF
uniref:C-type lectin domain-containing protein n=1 Tax=Panagrolaimus superbus TaxID=310955 RepID=A0A914YKP6_9BILA